MKKFTLLIVSIIATLSVFSQPVLTSSINLTTGDTYRYDGYSEVTNIEPGPGGANLTWDFSGITGEYFYEGIAAICVNPSVTPFADSAAIADANICTSPVGGVGPYQYYDNNNSSQNLIAMGFIGATNSSFGTYTDILTAFEFPFTYNNSFNGSSEFINYHIDFGYYFMRDSSITTVEADAYGTITTPLGEFQNALRIKRTTVNYSWMRFEAGGEWIPSGPFTDIEYSWFAPNIKVPVMFIDEMDGFPSYEARYLVEYDFTTGIEDQANYQLEIFPNPTADRLNINADKLINRISIYTVNGKQLEVVNLQSGQAHQKTINLSKYSKGVYLIEVGFEDGGIVIERIIKQ